MKNSEKSIENRLKKLLTLPKSLELSLIRTYQKTLSFDHGYLGEVYPNVRMCKSIPTCSEYGYTAVQKFGMFKGNYLLVRRVLRCNPWSKSEVYDPVPEN